uniref:Pleckstrin homology domain containing, family A member 5 n=1 Tax=Nothobranchius furzeri TaxID=105023 RepID=A0A8C6M1M3_NOTFU
MAADPKLDWRCSLPCSWSYGVTRDGRIFFINEEAKSTTWLHPVTGEAVITGHRKTPDLPSGWEEGYTFEGARCFINHNERKVTCKHPVSGIPSQDNCIFVVNEQSAPKASSEQDSGSDKKECPISTMSEASNYTSGSDYSIFPASPTTTTSTSTTFTSSTRPSRSSKKLHNFGKRSNSIKRNINAPVVKSNWLYKQDSAGMKLWKKRWFVLSDMCLFYYRDEKEDNILGSILLPSFHISMLSVDDHVSKKYAFKATHPNMRTYYFCTDTAKEMESWMKVMTDATLVHTEPIRRLDKLKADQPTPQENNLLNHKVLTRPEIQNNERNREPVRQPSLTWADAKRSKEFEKQHKCQREHECYTLQRDGEKLSLKKDGVSYMLQQEGERLLFHKDREKYVLRKEGEKYALQKDEESFSIHRDLEKCFQKVSSKNTEVLREEKHAPPKDREKYALQRVSDRLAQQKDGQKHFPQKEVRRQLSLKETERYGAVREMDNKYGTIHVVGKCGALREVRKYNTLRAGDRYAALTDADKYGFQRDRSVDRLVNSIELQPALPAAVTAAMSGSFHNQASTNAQKPAALNGSDLGPAEQLGDSCLAKVEDSLARIKSPAPVQEPDSGVSRTNTSQQLEPWVRTPRTRGLEEDTRSITSYQTLPRNMPSHRAQVLPRYPEGYRTLPRNTLMRPDSVCSVTSPVYDQGLRPASTSTVSTAEKRRSMRDDTMWQLYEWQQRQAFSRQSLAQPTAVGHYGTLPNMKTMGNISEHTVAPSITTSPSHGSLALYSTFSPPSQQATHNSSNSHSEVTSPILRGDLTLDRRHRTHPVKYGYPSDRRSIAAYVPPPTITPQSLQGKTSEELTLLLIKLRRQQAELNSLREHTVAQLMALGMEGPNAKTDVVSHHLQRNLVYLDSQINPDGFKEASLQQHTEEVDIDTKLSKLCEQNKAVKMQEEKLQQLHREKHTLETALQSASQELSEQSSSNPAATQSLVQQRDVLQSGLHSTCRELSRVAAELERSWREYAQFEAEVSLAKTSLLEQLESLGSPQTEPPSQRHIQIQKELWRIQDVMEALSKTKPQQSADNSFPGSKPLSSLQKNEQNPDYRLYKSEPELTTVKEEVDEANVENKDKTEVSAETKDTPKSKVPPYPVGIVPPRTKSPMSPPESSTIASYVTLRKTKKPESRSDRPRSAVDQMGFGEREVIKARMSIEEQLERMRRNQEALLLREKRRETPSRSPSFSKDNMFLILQSQTQVQTFPDQMELEAALQQIKVAHREQDSTGPEATGGPTERVPTPPQKVQREDQLKNAKWTEKQLEADQNLLGVSETQAETNSVGSESGESQRVVIVDLGSETKRVEIVNFEPVDDDKSKEEDLVSSPTNTAEDSSFQTLSPDLKEDDTNKTQEVIQEEKSLDSYKQLTTDSKNNNMMALQTFTMVNSNT